MEGNKNTSKGTELDFCPSCQSILSGPFCAACGKPKTLRRIDGSYVLDQIGSVFNLDKGFFYSIRELLLRPGLSVQHFLSTDRSKLVKPIVFILITSLIYNLAQRWLGFEDGYATAGGIDGTATAEILGWIQANYGYTNILMGGFIAFWIKVFFRKANHSYFEILVLLCFLMGIGMLLYTIFGVVEALTGWKLFLLGGFLSFAYVAWGIGSFFNKTSGWGKYIKALIVYLFGSLTFMLVAIIIGLIIDFGIRA